MTLHLVKYEAEWCGPCKMQEKMLEDFDTVPVEPVDIDENTLRATNERVRAVPTLILKDDAYEIERWTGVTPIAVIEDAIDEWTST